MTSPSNELGRKALVTGGGSGIGFACAERLAADGAQVTICGRTESRLASALERLPEGSRSVVADVTDADSLSKAVEVAADGGGLDVLVANAGGTSAVGPLMLTDPEALERDLELNITGTFLTLRAAAPALARAGGAFVAVSSIAAVRTHRLMASYSTAKGGLDMLLRNAADELGRFGVRVNGVRPGLVLTDTSDPLSSHSETRQDYLDQMPLGRVGQVEDIAGAVSFLSGPDASWITGEVISVDGGHHLRRGPDLGALLGDRVDDALRTFMGDDGAEDQKIV